MLSELSSRVRQPLSKVPISAGLADPFLNVFSQDPLSAGDLILAQTCPGGFREHGLEDEWHGQLSPPNRKTTNEQSKNDGESRRSHSERHGKIAGVYQQRQFRRARPSSGREKLRFSHFRNQHPWPTTSFVKLS